MVDEVCCFLHYSRSNGIFESAFDYSTVCANQLQNVYMSEERADEYDFCCCRIVYIFSKKILSTFPQGHVRNPKLPPLPISGRRAIREGATSLELHLY